MRNLKKVVIIQTGSYICDNFAKRFFCTNLTAPVIAAALPEYLDVEIIDMYVQQINYEEINADLAMVTTLTSYAPVAYEIGRQLRSRNIPVIIGGVHAIAMPDECELYFDSVVIGEAELLIDEILEDFRNHQLNKRYETKKQMDLTKCRMPRYDLLKLHKYSYIALMASKGCAFDCDFCSSSLVTGLGFRHKTVSQVLDEIHYLMKLQEKDPRIPRAFFFIDSNLYTDRKFFIELITSLIPLEIRNWGLFASVNIANDDEALDLLEKANCESIQIGFESINPASLKSVSKIQNNPEKYKEIVNKLASKGIHAYGSFIFGFDSDSTEVFDKTLKALEEADFINTTFATLTPYPGTRVFERLKAEGRILHQDWSKYDMEQVVFQPKQMTQKELYEGLDYVKSQSVNPDRLIKSLEKFNQLSNKYPKISIAEKIALILVYLLRFFKLKPQTRYFIKAVISRKNLAEYYQIAQLIISIQNR